MLRVAAPPWGGDPTAILWGPDSRGNRGRGGPRLPRDATRGGASPWEAGRGSATFGPAGLPRYPVDAEDPEPRGGEAAILGEAGTWLHFEWGQSLPCFPPPPGKQGVKHPPPTDSDTHTYYLFLLLPSFFLWEEVNSATVRRKLNRWRRGGRGGGRVLTEAPVHWAPSAGRPVSQSLQVFNLHNAGESIITEWGHGLREAKLLEFQSKKVEPCTLYYPWGPALSPSIKPLSTPQLPLKSLFFGTSQPPLGFPGGSAGKESACSLGDLGSNSGLGRSPGEGKHYELQSNGLENSMNWSQRVRPKGVTFTFTPTPPPRPSSVQIQLKGFHAPVPWFSYYSLRME